MFHSTYSSRTKTKGKKPRHLSLQMIKTRSKSIGFPILKYGPQFPLLQNDYHLADYPSIEKEKGPIPTDLAFEPDGGCHFQPFRQQWAMNCRYRRGHFFFLNRLKMIRNWWNKDFQISRFTTDYIARIARNSKMALCFSLSLKIKFLKKSHFQIYNSQFTIWINDFWKKSFRGFRNK